MKRLAHKNPQHNYIFRHNKTTDYWSLDRLDSDERELFMFSLQQETKRGWTLVNYSILGKPVTLFLARSEWRLLE